ncbi:holo-ACP synthase [Dyella sp.]|jgi:holo-[acyl-carrier protein] synthase|uniref:holo-ACP synthase n=1 Tax=Dyella sp. TaxID=1869338 RepID=UPI002D798376|nr:holo-ACP synthase [Dyella sp.]HET6431954.1 holo-ACP synthase [Dyella sp.]
MRPSPRTRVGIDLVRISAIAESLQQFGDRFLARVFTQDEVAYAMSAPPSSTARLAARFAAKEATRKALRLDGVGWRDIEVVRHADGACDIQLHGAARAIGGAHFLALSMSHEGDHATAVVIAERDHR